MKPLWCCATLTRKRRCVMQLRSSRAGASYSYRWHLRHANVTCTAETKGGKPSALDKMKTHLQGGRFRMLNERLYTSSGDDTFQLMQVRPHPRQCVCVAAHRIGLSTPV